ncbi:MAG: ATP-dependent transcriptional regulator, MalT-like, LuxR family [Pseudonocardiales bacterium]|nr:ATP-dependent transcriptional regulator, MalT-like, LuxR family [Pseudonocardiales bacterium]
MVERVNQVRQGHGGGLVVCGDSGTGKTALLDFAVGIATDLCVIHVAGAESERHLAYAGLHQLSAGLNDLIEGLPTPQRDALEVGLGLRTGAQPSRFLIGLATLGLLTEAARERPLLCAIDDVQWLDEASVQALVFAARRFARGTVLIIFTARWTGPVLSGLPELTLGGLRAQDARDLFASVVRWPLDERVRHQIVAETKGNPRALTELPRSVSPARLAGGFGLSDAADTSSISEALLHEIYTFPIPTRLVLLAAAADPTGDATLLRRTTEQLGIASAAVDPAVDSGFLQIGSRVVFRHLAARWAVYRSAAPNDRKNIHRALAEATARESDQDRRAWHEAQAAPGPDEVVAANLERTIGRAQARGGLAARAAFLEQAALLTPDTARRSLRALAAAEVTVQTGDPDATMKLLDMTDSELPADQARVDVVRAVSLARTRIGDAPQLLLDAARRLDPVDDTWARAAYRDAMTTSIAAGGLASVGSSPMDVASAVEGSESALLAGLAAWLSGDYAVGAAILRPALNRPESTADERRWMPLACTAAVLTWDDRAWATLAGRRIQLVRDSGALADLPASLSTLAYLHLLAGELSTAQSLLDEAQPVTAAASGQSFADVGVGLAALRGQLDPSLDMINSVARDAAGRGAGLEVARSHWAVAVLQNALGHYDAAFAAAEEAVVFAGSPSVAGWAMAELIEAAARTDQIGRIGQTVHDLSEITTAANTDWALGVRSRCLALTSDGPNADALYRAAIEYLARSRAGLDLARTHLVYGEWLRRENRRVDAREHLRLAYERLNAMGVHGFAERARRELLATGQNSRKRGTEASSELTAQEIQIAVRARNGFTNSAIGNELFLSPRTIEWHLRKVFMKLGITSRKQLVTALVDTVR